MIPQIRFVLDDETVELHVVATQAGGWRIGHGEQVVEAGADITSRNNVTVNLDGRAHRVCYAACGTICYFVLDGSEHVLIDTTYAPAAGACGAG